MRQKKNGLENLVLITQFGLNVVTLVLICVLLGSWIDKKTGLHTVLIFLILGVLSGGLSAYKMAKHIVDREKEDEDREKKEQVKQWESRFGTGDGADRPKDGGDGRRDGKEDGTRKRKRNMKQQGTVRQKTASAG